MEKVSSLVGSIFGGSPEPAAVVSSIFIYPIKSCRGISVPQACITSTALTSFENSSSRLLHLYLSHQVLQGDLCPSSLHHLHRWDRQWLVVNSKGRAYTQRVEPKLALVEVEMPSDAFSEDWEATPNSYMVIKAPGMDTLQIPLTAESAIIEGVSVWEWSGSAFDEGVEASEWFSNYLGKPSRLVRFNISSETRAVDPNYAQGHKTMFSDCFPFMLTSQGSLDALNEALKEPLPINRFRPNILVDGCKPFSEDLWKAIKISKLKFEGVKLCSRCKVPTINQENGIAGTEPTKTLMKFRSDHVLRPSCKQQGNVYFGQNLVCRESLSEAGKGKLVKVGDPVYVLQAVSSCAEAAA